MTRVSKQTHVCLGHGNPRSGATLFRSCTGDEQPIVLFDGDLTAALWCTYSKVATRPARNASE